MDFWEDTVGNLLLEIDGSKSLMGDNGNDNQTQLIRSTRLDRLKASLNFTLADSGGAQSRQSPRQERKTHSQGDV